MTNFLNRAAEFGERFVRDNTSTAHRTNLFGAAILFVLVNLTFFPFIWGGATLQESANDTPSLYGAGSRQQSVVQRGAYRGLDPGAAAWFQEPQFAVAHHVIFADKEPPIWNPYASFGTPLADDAEAQPYYPLAWFPVVSSSAEGYDLFIVSRIFVGALFAFLFLRLFIGFAPALIGGAAFMYSGYYWLYLTMPHLSVEVLLPAMLYCLERLLRRPGFGIAAGLAGVVACMLLGGMPESTALALTFGTVYVAARVALSSETRDRWRTYTPYLLLGTIIGGGISAVMMIPLLAYIPLSSNTHITATSNPALRHDVFSWSTLATYLAPLYLGSPWGNVFANSQGSTLITGFFGCGTFFLAACEFFSSISDAFQRRIRGAFIPLVLGGVAFALVLERFGYGFYELIVRLPIFHLVIFEKYEEAVIGCCVALLAGFGAARLYEKRATKTAILLAALLPLLILTIAAGENRQAFLQLPKPPGYYLPSLAAALTFLGLTGLAVIAFYRSKLMPGYFMAAILVIVVAEPLVTYVVPLNYVVNTPPPQSTSALLGAPYITFLQSKVEDHDRIFAQGGLLYPQWSEAFALADPRGLDGFYYKRYFPFLGAFLTDPDPNFRLDRFIGLGVDVSTFGSQRFFTLSSVRYVATPNEVLNSDAFRKVYDDNGVKVFDFKSPLPRVSIFHHVIRATTPEDALRNLTSTTFDPLSEAVVEGQPADFQPLTETGPSAVGAGSLQEYRSTFVRALVNTSSPALVVLNDTNFPGWYAFVDGRSTPIFDANYLFRGVVVPAGNHVIEYRYKPWSFTVGLAVTIASLLVLIGMIVAARKIPRATV